MLPNSLVLYRGTTLTRHSKCTITLVGLKHFPVFNPLYFFQMLVMHYLHRTNDELRDPREDRLPEPIKYFVPACHKLPQIFGSREAILEYFSKESHM